MQSTQAYSTLSFAFFSIASTLLTAFALWSVVVSATEVVDKSSDPFHLKIQSPSEANLNNKYLFACHVGADIRGLCVENNNTRFQKNEPAWIFYFQQNDTAKELGAVSWNMLLKSSDAIWPSLMMPMSFQFVDEKNVAPAYFKAAEAEHRIKWNGNEMVVPTATDADCIQAGFEPSNKTERNASKWCVCWSYLGAGQVYFRRAISWVLGSQPDNDSCDAVTVVKEKKA
ncbi:hypothetical protein B0H66DRAFT_629474 [Apodospora peruviana]|uniref:DUF7907 domain-containing protein n=1 Tax=Apodospora peruviana TaxID=516989 RepID=A0AAE0HV79_9PEZI|nr:hypothetical protein B0H66DRAFT_629474 [Apodospora peruviana]